MNRRKRNELHAILDSLEQLRKPVDKESAVAILQTAHANVERIMDEEQEALDARPESLQWSTQSEDMSENVDALSDVSADLEVLAVRCDEMDFYAYELIEDDIIKIVNSIKDVIHR